MSQRWPTPPTPGGHATGVAENVLLADSVDVCGQWSKHTGFDGPATSNRSVKILNEISSDSVGADTNLSVSSGICRYVSELAEVALNWRHHTRTGRTRADLVDRLVLNLCRNMLCHGRLEPCPCLCPPCLAPTRASSCRSRSRRRRHFRHRAGHWMSTAHLLGGASAHPRGRPMPTASRLQHAG